jgi:hypothetical protein
MHGLARGLERILLQPSVMAFEVLLSALRQRECAGCICAGNMSIYGGVIRMARDVTSICQESESPVFRLIGQYLLGQDPQDG